MTILTDIKSHLDTHWNTVTVAKPEFVYGRRARPKKGADPQYWNAIYLYDNGTRMENIGVNLTVRDAHYDVGMVVETAISDGRLDTNLSETMRIMGQTGMTGYEGRAIIKEMDRSNMSQWINHLRFVTHKYHVTI